VSATTDTAPAPRPRAAAHDAPVRGRERLILLAITAVALGLRASSLSRSLFADEAYSLALAQRSFGHMLGLFGYEANGTPYALVLWPLTRILGSGETALRLPALLAGVASVPALWWAARRISGRAVALLSAALLALSPMAVFYSQFARSYAFVVLAACLSFGALVRAVERPAERRSWIGYVLAMVLLAYGDILAAPIAIPAQAVIVLRGGRDARRRWLISLAAVIVCCVPLLIAAAISHGRRNALYWLPKPDRGLVTLAVQEFTAGLSGVSAVRWATLAAAAVVVAVALWSLRHARERDGGARAEFAIALCWGILPPVLLFIVSFASPVFWPRYAIVALPGLCLLFALAAVRVWHERRGLLVAGGCIAVIAAAAVAADVHQRTIQQEDWRPAAAWLAAERTTTQPVILDTVIVLPVLGYYYRPFRAGGDLVVKEWNDRPLPANLVGFKDPGGYGKVPDGPPTAAQTAALARRGAGTVWIVAAEVDKDTQGDPRSGAAATWARAHCSVQTRESTGVWVLRASSCRA